MKLYHSHATVQRYDYDSIPVIDPFSLTSQSTLHDACCSFVRHDLNMQTRRDSGKLRGHEPFCTLANSDFGSVPLADFDRRFAHRIKLVLFNEKKLAGGTVNGVLSKLRRLFAWLFELQIVAENPFQGMTRAPATKKRRATRALTAAEVELVLTELRAIRSRAVPQGGYADLFELGLLTSMRYNELLTLVPAQLRLDDEIPAALISEQYAKTRAAREVVLSPRAVELLRKYAVGKADNERLFACSYSALQERLNKLSHKLGISIFFHLTRHTAITQYATHAQSISELQAFSGHASKAGLEPYSNHDVRELRARVLAALQR